MRPPRAVSIDQLIRGDLKCMVSYRVELSRSISASQRPCSSFRSSSLPMVTSDETRPVEEPRTPRPRLPHCATPDDRTWPSWRSSRVGRKRCVIIRHRRDALDEEKRANERFRAIASQRARAFLERSNARTHSESANERLTMEGNFVSTRTGRARGMAAATDAGRRRMGRADKRAGRTGKRVRGAAGVRGATGRAGRLERDAICAGADLDRGAEGIRRRELERARRRRRRVWAADEPEESGGGGPGGCTAESF